MSSSISSSPRRRRNARGLPRSGRGRCRLDLALHGVPRVGVPRHCRLRGSASPLTDQVGIDSEELDQTLERGTELTEARANRRLELVIVEVAALRGGMCSLAMGAA